MDKENNRYRELHILTDLFKEDINPNIEEFKLQVEKHYNKNGHTKLFSTKINQKRDKWFNDTLDSITMRYLHIRIELNK